MIFPAVSFFLPSALCAYGWVRGAISGGQFGIWTGRPGQFAVYLFRCQWLHTVDMSKKHTLQQTSYSWVPSTLSLTSFQGTFFPKYPILATQGPPSLQDTNFSKKVYNTCYNLGRYGALTFSSTLNFYFSNERKSSCFQYLPKIAATI